MNVNLKFNPKEFDASLSAFTDAMWVNGYKNTCLDFYKAIEEFFGLRAESEQEIEILET